MKPAWALLLGAVSLAASARPDWLDEFRGRDGRWVAQRPDGSTVTLHYRTIAGGSVVVETWQGGTPAETQTVYHLDRGALVATHYCAQGNQPRLRLERATEDMQWFRWRDKDGGTGELRKRAHLDRLRFQYQHDGGLRRMEAYVAPDQKEEISELVFYRQPAGIE